MRAQQHLTSAYSRSSSENMGRSIRLTAPGHWLIARASFECSEDYNPFELLVRVPLLAGLTQSNTD